MSVPDPSNCPQTPTGKGDPALQAEPQSLQMPNPKARSEYAAGLDVTASSPPERSATTLVELWLLQNPDKRAWFKSEVAKLAKEVLIEEGQALARLEAWLAEDPARRSYKIYCGGNGPVIVQLKSGGKLVLGFEDDSIAGESPGPSIALAKTPGPAATVHAAIDKWESLEI